MDLGFLWARWSTDETLFIVYPRTEETLVYDQQEENVSTENLSTKAKTGDGESADLNYGQRNTRMFWCDFLWLSPVFPLSSKSKEYNRKVDV